MASNDEHHEAFLERAKALTDLEFTYVNSCQVYGNQKKSVISTTEVATQIFCRSCLKYLSLRVAHVLVDEKGETADAKSPRVFYSFFSKEAKSLMRYKKLACSAVCQGW
ncbi:putative callose synthase 6 [Raphanus sativus]|uniref:Callose synthase 6 n=1 Tax=Raphanus sativus TaxID=3726 RepID=A0A9W3DII8_RAPSA|nr:putative callose synthase 6 [Raphanus sativus]